MQQESWERVRDVIMHTLKLVKKGQIEKAFVALDTAIAEAADERQGDGALLLLRHAAALAMGHGKRKREIQYTKEALPYAKDYTKDYGFAAYNLSQLLLKDGQVDLAQRYALEAYELSCSSENEADRDLTTAIVKQWPSIAKNR